MTEDVTSADAGLPPTGAGVSGWRALLRRFGLDLQPGEGAMACLLFLYFFLIICFQYTTKSVRQSTYVYELGHGKLPIVYILVAVCSYPVLALYSRSVDRVRRHILIAVTSVLIALSMVAFWWLFGLQGKWIGVAFYVFVSIAYVLNVSQFWSYSNNALDPRQAKRLFGFIGAGGLLGGIAGGQVAVLATSMVDTLFSLLVSAVILLVAAGLIYVIQRLRTADDTRTAGAAGLAKLEEARGGLQVIRRSRHLQLIALIMLLTVVVANIVDFQFNWAMDHATAHLDESERRDVLTGGYGNFYTVMGIAALLFQLLFTARIHRFLGVGFAMRVLPITMAFGTMGLFLAATVIPAAMLNVCRLLKIGENGLRYSLDQATRELLFLPVPVNARLKAKAYIDVFIQRSGKAVAGVLLLTATFGLISAVQAGWLSLVLIVLWLGAIVAMRREYVCSFRSGLKQRAVDAMVPINVSDVTTLEMLVEALGSTDSRQVLHSVEMLASNGRGNLVSPLLLHHEDARVRKRTLEVLAAVGRRDAAPLIERRLGDVDPDVRVAAIRTLARLQRGNACTMMLPRLEDPDPALRAAAVACLANHGDEDMCARADACLADMLSDGDPAVRAEATKAVGTVREPRLQAQLLQLLYDADPLVVREAISAVCRRVARDGFTPVYSPTLISMLDNRRLKSGIRECLVAFGESVIPALVHFMNDPEERLWVRRALPRTIARIGTPAARKALLGGLRDPNDAFLRRELIEALGSLGRAGEKRQESSRIEAAIRSETRDYLQMLAHLCSLGIDEKGRCEGPVIRWHSPDLVPSFLEQLLAERMEDHLRNLFGLLSLSHPPQHIWSAHRSLLSGRAALRNYALEYLDNTLSGDSRRNVFLVIDDAPPSEKFRRASRSFAVSVRPKVDTLGEILRFTRGGDEDAAGLTMAAIYTVYTDGVAELYPRVETLAQADEPSVRETATWVARRLHLPAAH